MTTPLPQQSPGDRREDHALAAAAAMLAIYEQAELVIIAAIAALARKTASGTVTAVSARRQLQYTAGRVLDDAAPEARKVLEDAMQGASAAAREPAATASPAALLRQPAAPDVSQWARPLAVALDQATGNAEQAAQDSLAAVTGAVKQAAEAGPPALAAAPGRLALPPPSNPYREAVGQAFGRHGGWPGSTLSARRIRAAQDVLDDLAQHGITGFTDRAGRNWDLASYVEMATRTAVSNAWDDMQAQAMTRSGLDLIFTYTHSTEGSCPLCVPWLGRSLSLTGATPGYPTLAEAKAAGFRHPNCRCSWTGEGMGAMDVTNPVDLEQAAAAYKASQQQRALERKVREAGRRYHAAVTPQARGKARRDLATARAASAVHRQRHGVRMMKVSVQRRERPFGAR